MNLVEIEFDRNAGETAKHEIRSLSDSYPEDGASDREEPRGAGERRIEINEYFAVHPEMVLGEHGQRRGIYGPDPTYTCRPRPQDPPLEELLSPALARLPTDILTPRRARPKKMPATRPSAPALQPKAPRSRRVRTLSTTPAA
jgi:hypothetical protein